MFPSISTSTKNKTMSSTVLKPTIQADRRAGFLLRASVSALVLALVGWLVAVAQTSDQVIFIGLGILGTIILSLPLFFDRNYDIFEPMTAVFFLFLFGAPVKLCYIATVQDSNSYVLDRLLKHEPISAMIPGLMIVIMGLALLVFGYMLPSHKRAVPFLFFPKYQNWSASKLQLICFLVFLFSGACFLGFVAMAGVSLSDVSGKRFSDQAGSNAARVFSAKYYLYRLASFSKFPAYLSFAWLLHNRKGFMNWMGILCVLSALQTMLVCVVVSSRAGIALMLLDFILISYYVRGRRMKILKVGLFATVGIIGVMGVLAVRHDKHKSGSEIVEKTMAGRDMMDICKTVHIINAVPDKIEYRNGEMLYAWATALVPRSIWRDKPMWIERGPYIMQNVFDSKNKISGIPPGYIAELYWNFGWVGVAVGMLLFGYLARLCYLSFTSVGQNPVSSVIYVFFVTRFVLFALGNDLGTGMIKLGLDLVPLLMILWLVQKRRMDTSVYAGATYSDTSSTDPPPMLEAPRS